MFGQIENLRLVGLALVAWFWVDGPQEEIPRGVTLRSFPNFKMGVILVFAKYFFGLGALFNLFWGSLGKGLGKLGLL